MSSPPPDAAAPGPTYLSLASDGTLLRATRGSCDGDAAPVVQVSTDGQGFEDVTVDEGLREVLRVQADASDNVWLVGAGSNCRFGVYRGAAQWDVDVMPPGTARAAAALSLLLWVAVIACGRLLAYV